LSPSLANPTDPVGFTGCSGGTGTLSSADDLNSVSTPVVFNDPHAYSTRNAFPPKTQLFLGSQFHVVLDSGGRTSSRGLLRRLGAYGNGFGFGWYPEILGAGKLAGYRYPVWPR